MSTGVTTLMINVGPMLGAGAKLYAGAATLALVACGALHRLIDATPAPEEPGEYPFSSSVVNPWERDGGPAGL